MYKTRSDQESRSSEPDARLAHHNRQVLVTVLASGKIDFLDLCAVRSKVFLASKLSYNNWMKRVSRQFILSMTSFLCLAFSAHEGFSSTDCDRAPNSLKFICQSEPALLQAMSPGLNLPKCGESRPMQVQPGHLPSSAVFITCSIENIRNCSNISAAAIRNAKGATLNIVVASKDMGNPDVQAVVQQATDLARRNGTPLNVIPVVTRPKTYARDPAISLTNGTKTRVSLLPDEMQGVSAIAEAINQCRDIRSEYAGPEGTGSASIEEHQRISGRNDRGRFQGDRWNFEGGNTLVLPDGHLLYGENEDRNNPPHIIDYLANRQAASSVRLPNQGIGHIDEFFNIVPSVSNPCGFAILTASPKALQEWIETQPQSVKSRLAYGADWSPTNDREKAEQARQEQFEYEMNLPTNRSLSAAERQRYIDLTRRRDEAEGRRTLTWTELLQLRERQGWDVQQAKINAAKEQIWKRMGRTDCREEDVFVDLPMAWDGYTKRPILTNPVNGLQLNGSYLMSSTTVRGFQGYDVHRDQQGRFSATPKNHILPSPDLERFIQDRIRERTGMNSFSVDTGQTDWQGGGSGNGYLHCATFNLPLPCVP